MRRRGGAISPEPVIYQIYYYEDEHGVLHSISGSVTVGINNEGYITGLVINNILRPAFSVRRRMIAVNIRNNSIINMTHRLRGFGHPPRRTIQVFIRHFNW